MYNILFYYCLKESREKINDSICTETNRLATGASRKTIATRGRHLLSVAHQDEAGGVVEEHADAVVAQLVAEAVLVRVVDPLADPVDGHGGRVLKVVCNERKSITTLQRILLFYLLADALISQCPRYYRQLRYRFPQTMQPSHGARNAASTSIT